MLKKHKLVLLFPRTCHSPQGNFFSENCVETSFVSSCELGPPCDKVWTWIYIVLTSRDRSNAIAISATIISAPVVGLRCFIVYYLNVPHEQYLKSTANDWPTDWPTAGLSSPYLQFEKEQLLRFSLSVSSVGVSCDLCRDDRSSWWVFFSDIFPLFSVSTF